MKVQIRPKVFETNSSSSHSFCIATGDLTDSISVVNGQVVVTFGEFGWGVETYFDADTKLSYLYTWIMNHSDNKQNHLNYLDQLIKDRVGEGIEVIFDDPDPDRSEWFACGYIDHQSVDVAEEIMSKSEEEIKQFLFNDRSILLIDNDNH